MENRLQDYPPVVTGESTVTAAQDTNSLVYMQGSPIEASHAEHYVTIVQDGQTYAIPAADYQNIASQEIEASRQTSNVINVGLSTQYEKDGSHILWQVNCENKRYRLEFTVLKYV